MTVSAHIGLQYTKLIGPYFLMYYTICIFANENILTLNITENGRSKNRHA